MQNYNRQVLLLIRFLPFVFILMSAIVLYVFINYENTKLFEKNQEFIRESYIIEEKKRIESTVKRISNYLTNFEKQSQYLLKSKLKQEILKAYSIVENIYKKNKDKKSKEEIISLIKNSLQNIRFNEGRGYFFIYDMNGYNIFNPAKPYRESKNFINEKDSKGKYFQRDRIELLKKNSEVYFNYYFEKPNSKKESEKFSFLKKFEPFNWYIGTGEYLDDFKESIKKEALDYISKLEFKDEGYPFIVHDNIIILNKNKELIGLDLSKEKRFEKVFQNYKNIEKHKDGLFLQYSLIIKEKENIIENKVSFIKKFEKWNWVIGTGFDFDKLNTIIEKRQKKVTEELTDYFREILLYGTIIIAMLLLISYILSKYMEEILLKYQKQLVKKNKTLTKAQEIAKIVNWEVDLRTMEINLSDTSKIFGIEKKPTEEGIYFLKRILRKDDWDCFEKTIKDKKVISCLFTFELEDGKIVWIDCKGSYVKNENKYIGTFQDISELKKVEKEKQEKEKMLYQQSKMAVLGEMLANISHQWKQPLSTISTASTGMKLQKEIGVLDDKQFSEGMDIINETTQFLSTTIDDFKNFFKPKYIENEKIDISNSISKALKLMNARLYSSNIEVIKKVENIEFVFFENELIQVLLNLLNNAHDALVEFNNERKLIFINIFQSDEKVIIEIYDNANGIDPEIMDKIFEPYFTTKDEDIGTGIGLYMSHEIIKTQLQGLINVDNYIYSYESIQFKGARFTITLDKN